MKNKTIVGMIVLVLGVIIALIPTVIFPVCTKMIELMNGKTMFMKCHWSAIAELLVGILVAFNGLLLIAFKKTGTHIALSIMLFMLGVTALVIPTIAIGMCDADTMQCRVGTEPALIVASVITIIFGIGNTFVKVLSIRSAKLYDDSSVTK